MAGGERALLARLLCCGVVGLAGLARRQTSGWGCAAAPLRGGGSFSDRLAATVRDIEQRGDAVLAAGDSSGIGRSVQDVLWQERNGGPPAEAARPWFAPAFATASVPTTASTLTQLSNQGAAGTGGSARPGKPNWDVPAINFGMGWSELAEMLRYKPAIKSLKDSPFFQERYRQEFDAWRDSILYTNMKMRQDMETLPAFVPGVGYLRPFIRYPNFIKPDGAPTQPAGLFTNKAFEALQANAKKAAAAAKEAASKVDFAKKAAEAKAIMDAVKNDGSPAGLQNAAFNKIINEGMSNDRYPVDPDLGLEARQLIQRWAHADMFNKRHSAQMKEYGIPTPRQALDNMEEQGIQQMNDKMQAEKDRVAAAQNTGQVGILTKENKELQGQLSSLQRGWNERRPQIADDTEAYDKEETAFEAKKKELQDKINANNAKIEDLSTG